MNTEQVLLTHFQNWTIRSRPGTGKRLLLLLHGWTGSEDSMTIFIKHFPAEYSIISPRAPYPAFPGGYSWRASAVQGTWPSLDLFRPSIESLMVLADSWAKENNLDTSTFDVAGFSQGGALTFALGVLHPEKIRKMGVLSGFAPDGVEEAITPGLLNGKSIFVAHGALDDTVPISMAEHAIGLLKKAGAQVHYCQSEIGHKLSSDCLKAFVSYLID